jgi:AcrR family transcriptional regulator
MNPNVLAKDGRVIGARAFQTRRKLLDATARLLAERGVLDVKVVDVTRDVHTSPATFYQYFADVTEAILALADEAAADSVAVIEVLDVPWTKANARAQARAFTLAYMDYHAEHQAILRVRNLRAEEGDPRFRDARSRASQSLMEAMMAKLRAAQDAGRVADHLNPYASAAAMVAVLERLVAYQSELGRRGVSRDALVDTIACLLVQTLTGWRC